MDKVTVTKEQMEAVRLIKEDKVCNLKNIISIISRRGIDYTGSVRSHANSMTLEQIILAWHGHVEIKPDIKYVQMGEAMVASDEGYTVHFHSEVGDVKRVAPCEAFGVSIGETEINDETLMDLLRGKWSIED